MGEGNAFYREFGGLVRASRKAAGLSQTDLAAEIGLTRSSVSNVEKGKQKVVLHTFAAILDVLGKRPSELLPVLKSEEEVIDERVGDLDLDSREFVERAIGITREENDANSSRANQKGD